MKRKTHARTGAFFPSRYGKAWFTLVEQKQAQSPEIQITKENTKEYQVYDEMEQEHICVPSSFPLLFILHVLVLMLVHISQV